MTEPTLSGTAGQAWRLPLPDNAMAAETVAHWLLTAPAYHPFWDQYTLAMVRLRHDIPGFPDPVHDFDGSTHELLILTLNPENGPFDVAKMAKYATGFRAGKLPILMPPGVKVQFEGTDEEMDELTEYAALAVVNGWMSPEPPFSTASHWEDWKASMVKTLAHIRGEAHAE